MMRGCAFGAVFCGLLAACISDGNNNPPADQISKPALKTGDLWVQQNVDAVSGDTTEDTVEIVNDAATFGSEAVYEAQVKSRAATFATAYGLVRDLSGISRIYLRKSDQRPVYLSSNLNARVAQAGTFDTLQFRMLISRSIAISGSEPATLKPGLAWQTTETVFDTTQVYLNDSLAQNAPTQESFAYSYKAEKLAEVTVKAGVFKAMEISYGVAATGLTGTKYYSQAAKINVKVIEKQGGLIQSQMELKSFR